MIGLNSPAFQWSPVSEPTLSIQAQRGSELYSNCKFEWEALIKASSGTAGRPLFYSSPSWLEAWARFASSDHEAEPLTFVAQNGDGQWLGVLPLALQRARIERHKFLALTMAGWPFTDTVEIPSADGQVRRALLEFAWRYARSELNAPWHALMLREIGEDGPTSQAVDDFAAAAGLPVYRTTTARSPVLDLQEFHQREVKRRHSQVRRLSKFRKKMERRGRPDFRFERLDPTEVDERLAFCTQVDEHSWKGKDASASFLVNPERRTFVRELWQCLAAAGNLALATLTLDQRPVGYHWGPIEGDRFLSLMMAYDEEFRSHGVGTVILDDMIESGPAMGLRWLDASRGGADGSHILGRYECPDRVQQMVVIYRPNLAGTTLRLRREWLAPTLKRIRHKTNGNGGHRP